MSRLSINGFILIGFLAFPAPSKAQINNEQIEKVQKSYEAKSEQKQQQLQGRGSRTSSYQANEIVQSGQEDQTINESVLQQDTRNNAESQGNNLLQTLAPMNQAIGNALLSQGAKNIATGKAQKPDNWALIAAGIILVGMGQMANDQAAADAGWGAGSYDVVGATDQFQIPDYETGSYDGTDPYGGSYEYGDGSGDTYDIPGYGAGTATDGGPGGRLASAGSPIPEDLKAALAEEGFSLSPDGKKLTTASGDTIDVSDLTDAEKAAAALGTSVSTAAGAIGAGKQLADQIATKFLASKGLDANFVSMGLANTPGGGGGFGSAGAAGAGYSNEDGSIESYMAGIRKRFRKNKKQQAEMIAGKAKVVDGGESIGVKADDIFAMIQRRYNVKKKARLFDAPKRSPLRRIASEHKVKQLKSHTTRRNPPTRPSARRNAYH